MSVVIARSVSDEAIWKGQRLNGGERLLRFARNDMIVHELATVTDKGNILIAGPRIKGNVLALTEGCEQPN
jgi:hypothetical protein